MEDTPRLNFMWHLVWDFRAELLQGLLTAFEVAITALILSLFVGLFFALMKMSRFAVLRGIASTYINIFRGIPALVSVVWVYFGWSLLFGYNFTVYQAGVIALTLLYSSFFAEIFRSALEAVHKGQREAGQALGMSRLRMIKDTSTFTVIGLAELVFVMQSINAEYFQPFVLFTAAAGLYVAAAFLVDFVFRMIEGGFSYPKVGRVKRFLTRRKRAQIQRLVDAN
ncbi:MAG: amino acid ABC transporter permease [Actinobacteria bacterium]|nr:amino acid ABC transporter permease [Actinomycetota bacterium]